MCGATFLLLAWRTRHVSSKNRILNGLLVPAGIYLVAKPIFLTLAIDTFGQGYWYYFTLVTICNLVLAIFFLHLLKNTPQIVRVAGTFLFMVTCFTMPNTISYASVSGFSEANLNFMQKNEGYDSNVNYNDVVYNLWINSESIKSELNSRSAGDKLIDNFDGLFGYVLDMPAEALTGLALSKQALEDRAKKGVLESVISRGYKIIPAYGYLDPRNFSGQVLITDIIKPAASPIFFFKLALTHTPADGKR